MTDQFLVYSSTKNLKRVQAVPSENITKVITPQPIQTSILTKIENSINTVEKCISTVEDDVAKFTPFIQQLFKIAQTWETNGAIDAFDLLIHDINEFKVLDTYRKTVETTTAQTTQQFIGNINPSTPPIITPSVDTTSKKKKSWFSSNKKNTVVKN